MALRDLRDFLSLLKQRNQLKRVRARIRVDRGHSELSAVMRLLQQDQGPALIMDNPVGSDMPQIPLVFNPFGTRERTAWIVGENSWLEAKQRVAEVLDDRACWHAPVVLGRERATSKEVVILGEGISLDRELPAVWYGKEGPSYVQFGGRFARSGDRGTQRGLLSLH